jgi:microcystin-dependent protein
MSQHDFDIANQTASNARSDINNALKALASLSSGTSAPSTTYANQLWYDTTNNQIKKRNEANSGWVVLGTVDDTAGTFLPTAGGLPAGAVQVFAMNSAPSGWLSCDGSAISRTTYSTLFSAISTTYGTGDGSTTFNLPDLRGEFIRGWDAGRGIDSGRTFGTAQSDAFEAHNHNVSWTAAEGGSGAGSRVENYNAGYNNRVTETVGDANETRPRNIAMLYCIKY